MARSEAAAIRDMSVPCERIAMCAYLRAVARLPPLNCGYGRGARP
jgi:hypothetical protein